MQKTSLKIYVGKVGFYCIFSYSFSIDFESFLKNCVFWRFEPFKRQPHKMVKHTQAIRRLLPPNCLSVIDRFVRLALKGLTYITQILQS